MGNDAISFFPLPFFLFCGKKNKDIILNNVTDAWKMA